jgi:hypothetical protein
MLQVLGTILFFVVFLQLVVALSLYTWLTIYNICKKSKPKKTEE